MWLTLDIGNSALKGGLFEEGVLTQTFRLEPPAPPVPAVWTALLEEALPAPPALTRIGLASVVPAVTQQVRPFLESFGVPLLDVHHRLHLPFTLAYGTPETLGTDRLAAAASAWMRYGRTATGGPRAVMALDAGTAVTFDVVDRHGTYRGGTISAGPQLLRDALHQGTAQLPPVPLELPTSAIGRTTQQALQAGLLFPFIDGVRGLLTRLSTALDERPLVVATGGWSVWLQAHIDAIDHVDPHLVLHGIHGLMTLNEPPP